MNKRAILLIVHVAALLMACTGFTLLTAPLGGSQFRWSFFAYAYANGWGYQYHSNYTFLEVLAYLVAYGSGVMLYRLPTRPALLGRVGMLISILGVASFAFELSHWFFEFNLCLIASFPAALLLIVTWQLISTYPRKPRPIVA